MIEAQRTPTPLRDLLTGSDGKIRLVLTIEQHEGWVSWVCGAPDAAAAMSGIAHGSSAALHHAASALKALGQSFGEEGYYLIPNPRPGDTIDGEPPAQAPLEAVSKELPDLVAMLKRSVTAQTALAEAKLAKLRDGD